MRRRAVSTRAHRYPLPAYRASLHRIRHPLPGSSRSRRKVVSGPVAPPGRCPEHRGGGSCTHALPLSRRNPRRSTPELRMFATRSCPRCRPWTGASGSRCWSTGESGRCIATTAWEAEEAMRASAEQVAPVRDRAAEMFGGSANVEEWEIAVLHRDHRSGEGACVRATWLKVAQRASATRSSSSTGLRAAGVGRARRVLQRQPDGRPRIRACGVVVTFDSRDAMDRTASRPGRCGRRGCGIWAPTSSTSANSSWRSPICGCPSWSDAFWRAETETRAVIAANQQPWLHVRRSITGLSAPKGVRRRRS